MLLVAGNENKHKCREPRYLCMVVRCDILHTYFLRVSKLRMVDDMKG